MTAVMTTPLVRTTPRGRARPAAPRAGSRPRRLAARYRRRRLAVALAVVGAVLALGRAGGALGGSSLTGPERRPQVVTHVVEPGDTLWSIAGELAPGEDRRTVVDAWVEARGGAELIPGEVVRWQVRSR